MSLVNKMSVQLPKHSVNLKEDMVIFLKEKTLKIAVGLRLNKCAEKMDSSKNDQLRRLKKQFALEIKPGTSFQMQQAPLKTINRESSTRRNKNRNISGSVKINLSRGQTKTEADFAGETSLLLQSTSEYVEPRPRINKISIKMKPQLLTEASERSKDEHTSWNNRDTIFEEVVPRVETVLRNLKSPKISSMLKSSIACLGSPLLKKYQKKISHSVPCLFLEADSEKSYSEHTAATNSSKKTIVYFHANGEDLNDVKEFCLALSRLLQVIEAKLRCR